MSDYAGTIAPENQKQWSLLKVAAWASMIANTLIIATGGAVRLTGSGLGCPTWPLCTPDSLVPTGELSWHSAIEFGNRLMTGVLCLIAGAVIVLVWRWRKQRRDLFVLALIVIGGILLQAVVGGITVWTGLNPVIVGIHYVASTVLVAVATAFIAVMPYPPGPRQKVVPESFLMLLHLVSALVGITIIIGVLTTANGPHSGDANVLRNGIDAQLLAHFHAWPGYALAAMALIALLWAVLAKLVVRRFLVALVLVIIAQIAVGVYQARFGLPPFAVGVHMVLAAVTASITVFALIRCKKPVSEEEKAIR